MDYQFSVELDRPNQKLELMATHFSTPGHTIEISSFRGKVGFQWSRAVRALTILTLATKLNADKEFIWKGTRGSLVSSLDYAIAKSPQWTVAMFGSYRAGTPLIKRIFKVTNSGCKLGPKLAVAYNSRFLNNNNIEVLLKGKPVAATNLHLLVAELFHPINAGQQRTTLQTDAPLTTQASLHRSSTDSQQTRISYETSVKGL